MNNGLLFLKVGDTSNDGKLEIVDEDRLCFLVKGANGSVRTISKRLLCEFVEYFINTHKPLPPTQGTTCREKQRLINSSMAIMRPSQNSANLIEVLFRERKGNMKPQK